MEDSVESSGVAVLEKPVNQKDLQGSIVESGTKDLKRSSYGRVTLVSSPIKSGAPRKEGLGSKVKAFLRVRQELEISTERFDLAKLALKVLNSGQISGTDVKNLPSGFSEVDKVKLANVLATLNKFYSQKKFDKERITRQSLPYDFGLVLSDFIEVLPTNLAARMILAAASPDIARRILMGEGTIESLEANDTQQAAVEAVVLLPRGKRDELFTEMSKLQPGREGGAYRFFAFIASNWSNRYSDHSGQKLIELNLPSEQADIKLKEMAVDLQRLGAFLRGEKSNLSQILGI